MILYHYTNAKGLAGIITKKVLWASDYRFLNDTNELNYGLSVFGALFGELSKGLPPEVVEVVGNLKRAFSEFSLLITSFCDHDDLLSQWRGYNGGMGYALGIDAQWLTNIAGTQGANLIPTVYETEQQHQVVVDEVNMLKGIVKDQSSLQEIKIKWWPRMLTSIAAVKNKHFAEEREWRVVKVAHSWPQGICTRLTQSGLVPYLPINLNPKKNFLHHRNLGFERIVVGPGLSDQQITAVDALLASQHMRFEIAKSGIPFIPR
jgi:hypothetical protein